MDSMTGVEDTLLSEGVKFLYLQAGEILKGWRERRRDRHAPPPIALEPPDAVKVADPAPLADPTNDDMRELLQELKDLVEPVRDGKVEPGSLAGRQAIASLRELLEVVMRSPITFAGEAPRSVNVADVDVIVKRVSGQVRGVRIDLDKLQGPASIKRVRVQADDVDADGTVTGADLT